MIDALLSQLKDQVAGELKSKADMNDDEIDKVVQATGKAADEEIGNSLSVGNIGTLMNLFSSKSNDSSANSLQNSLQQTLTQKVVEYVGVDQSKAQMIAGVVLPQIMNLITSKNEETPEDDSSPLMDMFSDVVSGGGNKKNSGGGLLGKLAGSFFGK
ncbi:MAG: hypothetical protein GVX96_03085 [Bacteroidetes bacterium]|jgi:hypothetical protein|nr:hypothetical protein [Bacteroidota bacterium]